MDIGTLEETSVPSDKDKDEAKNLVLVDGNCYYKCSGDITQTVIFTKNPKMRSK